MHARAARAARRGPVMATTGEILAVVVARDRKRDRPTPIPRPGATDRDTRRAAASRSMPPPASYRLYLAHLLGPLLDELRAPRVVGRRDEVVVVVALVVVVLLLVFFLLLLLGHLLLFDLLRLLLLLLLRSLSLLGRDQLVRLGAVVVAAAAPPEDELDQVAARCGRVDVKKNAFIHPEDEVDERRTRRPYCV